MKRDDQVTSFARSAACGLRGTLASGFLLVASCGDDETKTTDTGQIDQPTATGSDDSRNPSAADVNLGIPTTVNADTDLASQGPDASSDSIYFAARVQADSRRFGILVQTVQDTAGDVRVQTLSVTDETMGYFDDYQTFVAKEEYTWSTEALDIEMPGLTWSGDAKHMAVQASAPWGSLDFSFEVQGPVMNYAGTGEWEALGEPRYEFALPSMRTVGTLTVQGETYDVDGEAWLDRQWGGLRSAAAIAGRG